MSENKNGRVNIHRPSPPRIHIIELEDMKSLLKLSTRAILKIQIDKYYIFYTGEANENFIGIHAFISDRDYKNYLSLDEKTDSVVEHSTIPKKHFVPVCSVKRDLWTFTALFGYMIRTGYIVIQKEKKEDKENGNKNKADST